MVNLSIHHQPAADAAAERDVEHRIEAHPRAAPRLAERRDVGVIVHPHRRTRSLAEPGTEWEIRPSFDLMRAGDASGLPIHRPAKADARGRDLPTHRQFRQGRRDLRANAWSAPRAIHGQTTALEDVCGLIADDELQFGAADFQAEKMIHGVMGLR